MFYFVYKIILFFLNIFFSKLFLKLIIIAHLAQYAPRINIFYNLDYKYQIYAPDIQTPISLSLLLFLFLDHLNLKVCLLLKQLIRPTVCIKSYSFIFNGDDSVTLLFVVE